MAHWGFEENEVSAMSFQEIANEMGLTLNDVRWLYRRAMRKLSAVDWQPAQDLIAMRDEDRSYATAIRSSGAS